MDDAKITLILHHGGRFIPREIMFLFGVSGKVGPLCPAQYSRLEREIHFANQWTPIWCGDQMGVRYEVHMWGEKVEVNLAEWTRTCRFWQLTGMPCRHAIAAITHKEGKPEEMCNDWLCINAYNAIYDHFIHPVQGSEYWAHTEYVEPAPPHKKVQRGRPKKNRRRDADEDMVEGHRLKRKLNDFICQRCGLTKHNLRGCKNFGCRPKPKGYVTPPTTDTENDLLAQDEQALNEAEQANVGNLVPPIPIIEEGPVEINLSQPNLSQESDMEFMVPESTAVDIPPVPRYKLNIRRPTQRSISDTSTASAPVMDGPPATAPLVDEDPKNN